jgi:hypothetical protein
MREGTLIVLTSDPDEVGLVAHRRFIPASRPRDGRIAHTAAWRGFTITDRRHEFAHRAATTSTVLTGGGNHPRLRTCGGNERSGRTIRNTLTAAAGPATHN